MATPEFLQTGVLDEGGGVDLASRPRAPMYEGAGQDGYSQREMIDFINRATEIMSGDPSLAAVDRDYDIDFLRQLLLTRSLEAQDPSLSKPQEGPMTRGQEVLTKRYESNRLKASMQRLNEAEKYSAALKYFENTYPDIARDIGLTPKWHEKIGQLARGAASKGFRALDIVLRNLDRGRGAIVNYELAVQQGATHEEASRMAKAALMGAEKGWTWIPEKQAPSFKEVLTAAGIDDDLTLNLGGLALDVLVDPVNILGVGASRKGIEVGAHQILNSYGRNLHGKMVRGRLDEMLKKYGVASDLELPIEALDEAGHLANAEMRALINQSPETAQKYLDMGGLKIAGYTLPGTAFIQKREVLRGGVEFDYVSESLARMFGRGSLEKIDRLGEALKKEGGTALQKKLGEFMQLIPANLREAGRLVGLIFHRTSPQAGKEYAWFKQAEYYDKLGYSDHLMKDKASKMFAGIDFQDLEALPFAIERGGMDEFINDIAVRKGHEYAGRVQDAVFQYRTEMDRIILDEVERGFINRHWQDKPQVISDFRRYVESGGDPRFLRDPSLVAEFNRTRIENYVPHVYHNIRLAHKLSPPPRMPRAPNVVEPFVMKRILDTLDQAIDQGLQPELNMQVLATTRMISHGRAITTHRFLEQAMEKFGANRAGMMGAARVASLQAGKPLSQPLWKDLMEARTDYAGKAILPHEQQLEIARALSLGNNVPPKAVARLNESAISEFLRHRLRVVTAGKSARIWQRYVVGPTQEGLYDGLKLAPARTEAEAVAKARDLVDPAYPDWGFVKAGGLADPEKLGDMLFPLPIVEDLERLNVKPSGEFRRVMRLYDVLNYWWKRNVTVIWPAFHFRNKLTNLVNSAMDIGLGGIMDRSTMWGIVQGADGVLKTPSGQLSFSQVRQLARRHGVSQITYRRADISAMIQDVVRGETKETTKLARRMGVKLPGREKLAEIGEQIGPQQFTAPITVRNLQRLGEEVGMVIENSDRMQLFVKSLQRGMTPEQAARRVKQFLFDYDDIGRFEKGIIRRFFNPFWTWTRKNLALQSKLAVKTPGRFVVPSKVAKALSQEQDDAMRSDLERELLPRYLSDTYGIRLETAGAVSKWLMNLDMPMDDLNRMWQGSAKKTGLEWMSMIAPYVKGMVEFFVDKDFHTGRDKAEFIRGTKVYEAVEMLPEKWKNWLEVRRRPYRDQMILAVDSKKWNMVMWMTLMQGQRFYTTIGRALDKKSGSVTQRMVNFLTGLRIEDIRPHEELRRMADAAVKDRDRGLLEQMKAKFRDARDMLILKGHSEAEADTILMQTHEAIRTPVYGAELATEDTKDYYDAEE